MTNPDYFLVSNTLQPAKEVVKRVLGIHNITNPEKYLGLPAIVGRNRNKAYRQIKERIISKINKWSSRLISHGGKEIFIKAVLQAIPSYTMSCFQLPKNWCDQISSAISNYWWKQKPEK